MWLFISKTRFTNNCIFLFYHMNNIINYLSIIRPINFNIGTFESHIHCAVYLILLFQQTIVQIIVRLFLLLFSQNCNQNFTTFSLSNISFCKAFQPTFYFAPNLQIFIVAHMPALYFDVNHKLQCNMQNASPIIVI